MMMKTLLFAWIFFASLTAKARVEVLFHPHDAALEKIASWIVSAQSRVDIAMYNMDVSDQSPVIQALKSGSVQSRLASGQLKIRMIFEGYAEPEANAKRMSLLESLGLDVRTLDKKWMVHHKFAVIDPNLGKGRLISGSANWSLSSAQNYNENILFFEDEPEPLAEFQKEFDGLWEKSAEFGEVRPAVPPATLSPEDQSDFAVSFNSARLLDQQDDFLYEQIVKAIDQAQSEIHIASTRIRLPQILDSLLRAQDRGVQIFIVVSQDDFLDLGRRAKWLLGKPNLHLRVKFYSLQPSDYLSFQMHHKFMVVDGKTVLTGSYNWSRSAEENHIENLIRLDSSMASEILTSFENEYAFLWDLGRDRLADFQKSLQEQKQKGEVPVCRFTPMVLDVKEIRQLLALAPKCRKK